MKKCRMRVFQHEEFEGPGSIATWANSRGHEIKTTRLYAGDKLPKPEDYDWLIVMGGSMGVHDTLKLPWMKNEKAHLKQAIEMDKPILGICLGAQLLADVLGAAVTKNAEPEIGWFPVSVAANIKNTWVGKILPNEFTPFHWHGDTFTIPKDALALGESAACAHQGFLFKDQVLGLQFHPEITPLSMVALIQNCGNELVPRKYVQDEKALQAGLPNATAVNQLMDEICLGFENKVFGI